MTYREKYRAAIKLDTEILSPAEVDRFRKKMDHFEYSSCPCDFFDSAPGCPGVCECIDCWNQEAR